MKGSRNSHAAPSDDRVSVATPPSVPAAIAVPESRSPRERDELLQAEADDWNEEHLRELHAGPVEQCAHDEQSAAERGSKRGQIAEQPSGDRGHDDQREPQAQPLEQEHAEVVFAEQQMPRGEEVRIERLKVEREGFARRGTEQHQRSGRCDVAGEGLVGQHVVAAGEEQQPAVNEPRERQCVGECGQHRQRQDRADGRGSHRRTHAGGEQSPDGVRQRDDGEPREHGEQHAIRREGQPPEPAIPLHPIQRDLAAVNQRRAQRLDVTGHISGDLETSRPPVRGGDTDGHAARACRHGHRHLLHFFCLGLSQRRLPVNHQDRLESSTAHRDRLVGGDIGDDVSGPLNRERQLTASRLLGLVVVESRVVVEEEQRQVRSRWHVELQRAIDACQAPTQVFRAALVRPGPCGIGVIPRGKALRHEHHGRGDLHREEQRW